MLHVTCTAGIAFAFLPLLTACESAPYGYGYANESKRTVTVVERSRTGADRLTFTPEAKQLPVEGGSLADRVDVIDFKTPDGRKHVLYFDTTRLRAGMVKRI